MQKQLELRLTGSGGQGLITAGIILAEAALKDNKNAIQTQSYGPEARGGASKAEVIISESDIDFPKVTLPNMVLSLTQVACNKYITDISEDGIIIVDETLELPEGLTASKVIKAPILRTARTEVGKEIVANIVALGLIVGLSNVVTKENLEKAILARIPRGTEDLNKMALQKGYELAKNY
ncbi:2-oxoacid:acceptor oxidoreductase family protein [Fusibacter tunisiensis]|jgi:2-oxoglutarate ferredoxin oxidoreductase subunit gamma|uniref:2-oxoglutarate ferredoxin oxidoreductase subunit gamma n=1 Tax=Fusibacter tunisiensis TaxID=1008308 RepID=A0ABS2MQ74_9FIRM|nr:2-oxoacid:acceptor oxidoreductase family protein [Fusibacter tunisiensis]MBM7561543.1 2-oxoglutarate ferredoxin oxidoreductase subunit gamma [Fusibacter tunisiensis]